MKEDVTIKCIFRTLDVAFARDTKSNKYLVLCGCSSNAEGELNFEEKHEYVNYLEAWGNYVKAVDLLLKRKGQALAHF